jgi:biopolymer transport protein ExbD
LRIPSHHDDRRQTDIAMTPMIDVVFQLMIFFICTASFQLTEELLPTSLAIAAGSDLAAANETPDEKPIIARATYTQNETQWSVNDRPCGSLLEVEQMLRAAAIDPALPVILDVAGEVPLGDMIDLYDRCRVVGFERIQFAVASD